MADPTRDQLRQQAKQYLDSLRASGVEWLPREATIPSPDHDSGRHEMTTDDTTIGNTSVGGSAGSPDSEESRRLELTVLAERVSVCVRCPELASTRTHTVFGEGPLDAELLFMGEAPGADEDRLGKPFVGAAGQLLNRIIAACGFQREEVYICNTIKCRPPGNRTPKPEEAANCREYLDRQLELVRPKFICCLGSTAAMHLLATTTPLGKLRGRFHDYRGTPVVCTYHPAYLLPHRQPAKKKEVWDDMKMLLARMGRPIPVREEPPTK